MTYKEYIYNVIKRFAMTETDAEMVCINQAEIIPNSDDPVDPKVAKMALYNEMSTILPVANVSEGGYSISWNIQAVTMWYKALANELSMPNVLASNLEDNSDIW